MSQTVQEEIKAQVTSVQSYLKIVEVETLKLRMQIVKLCEENASLKEQLAITEQKLQVFELAQAEIMVPDGPSARPSTSPSARSPTPTSAETTPSPSAPPMPTTVTRVHPPTSARPSQAPEWREKVTEDLREAVEREEDEAVEAAIEAGADVRARIGFGDTPLHEAARRGREAAVRSLIAHGAEVDEGCLRTYTATLCRTVWECGLCVGSPGRRS